MEARDQSRATASRGLRAEAESAAADKAATADTTAPAVTHAAAIERDLGARLADTLYSSRTLRTFNVIDERNREVLGIEVAHSIPSLRVIRVMEQLIELYCRPRALRLDNGSELTSIAFTE